jgi:translation initiation factor 2B subunit (eIF-2B alpha/beta/delta family)
MHGSQRLDALVTPLREDVFSGAVQVARTAADVLRLAVERVDPATLEELRSLLLEVGLRVLDAQPAMAPLVRLVSDVLDAASRPGPVSEVGNAATEAARSFAFALEKRSAAVADRAAALLPPDGDVLTLSASSTVIRALLRDAPAARRRVVVLEGRPLFEGRDAARALAAAGVPVLFAVDAAAGTLVEQCGAVLLGADSIGDVGVVNKVGSRALALAARHAGVPLLVAADVTKILPPAFPQHLADDRPGDQVWDAPEGVEVWNRYFEAVPLPWVEKVITDRAAFAAQELEAFRRELEIAEEVRAWAERRTVNRPLGHQQLG